MNLNRRRFHLRQVVIHLRRNHAFAQQNVRTHQPQGIRDDGVEIKHAADNAFIFPHQRTNPANDFARALTVGHHVLQQLLQQNRVNVAALEKTSRGRGIVSDGGKRLIQFVRDRSGHFPHQRHAIQMCQLFALYLQLEAGLLLRADINRYPDKFQKTSVLVLQTPSAHDDPAGLAVRQNESVLRFEDSVRSARAIKSGVERGSFIRMHARADQVASQRQLGIKSVNLAPFVTHPSGVLFGIDDPKGQIGRFRREIDACITLAQGLLPSLALDRDSRDVRGDLGQSCFFCVGTALFLPIHCKRSKDITFWREDRRRPTCAQTANLRQMAVISPKRIGHHIGHHHRPL